MCISEVNFPMKMARKERKKYLLQVTKPFPDSRTAFYENDQSRPFLKTNFLFSTL